jgi:peptidoglycan/LPS O-acetylase OafA/YrhL
MQTPVSRAPWIDTLKGAACIAIVWHHLAFYGPMSDVALPLAPNLIAWLYDHARLAVQVFLVLGGYLAASSLAPQGWVRFDGAAAQIGKRFVRLMIPLAAALAVAMAAAALVRPWLEHPSVPDAPRWPQLLAHVLLLQDLVGEEALSAGVWYVAIDFQLFAGTVLVLAGVRTALSQMPPVVQARAVQAVVLAGVAASLFWANLQPELDVWGLYFFGAYGLGMLACWAVRSPRPVWWWGLMAALAVAALAWDYRSRIALAAVTALTWRCCCARCRSGLRGHGPGACSVWAGCPTRSFWSTFRSACWSTPRLRRPGPPSPCPMPWAWGWRSYCRWWPDA